MWCVPIPRYQKLKEAHKWTSCLLWLKQITFAASVCKRRMVDPQIKKYAAVVHNLVHHAMQIYLKCSNSPFNGFIPY